MAGEKEKKILNSDEANRLIRSLIGQTHILTVPRVFIDYTGDIESALLLSQLLYWSGRATRADGYVWKTYRQWEEEVSLNEYQVSKAARRFKRMGILKTVVRKAGGNPTVHYLLQEKDFLKSFTEFLKKRKSKISKKDSSKTKTTINRDYLQRLPPKTTDDKENASPEGGSTLSLVNQVISEYYKVYEEVHGTPHPVLKEEQLQKVCFRLGAFAEEYYLELEEFRSIIRGHFSRTDGLITNGNINHFATPGILKNLYYRCCY